MERQFFSGNTLEQAVLAAARYHNLEPDRVAYKQRAKKHGFVNIRRRVVIEVDPASPEQTETRVEHEPLEAEEMQASQAQVGHQQGEEAHDEARQYSAGRHLKNRPDQKVWCGQETSWSGSQQADDEVEAVERAVKDLGDLVGISLTNSIQREGRGFELDLTGPDSSLLRENLGSGLDAMEHLLPRLVRGLNGHGVPCRVDSAGFRTAREEELGRLARDTADDVRRERVEIQLEPMNPADRRQVHMALVDDPTVRTESEGDGFMKCVRIVPS